MSEKKRLLVVLAKSVQVDRVTISRLTRSNTGRIGDPGEDDGPLPTDEYEVAETAADGSARSARKFTGGVPENKLSQRIFRTALNLLRKNRVSDQVEACCALIDPWPEIPAAPPLSDEE